MEITEISDLLLMSIQIIGIFVAIIGGLLASKLLSMNEEKEQTNSKIELLEKKIKHNDNKMKKLVTTCYERYKLHDYDLIIDQLFDNDWKYNIYEYKNPYVNKDMRETFVNEVFQVIKDIEEDVKVNNLSNKEICNKHNFIENSIEQKIVEYYVKQLEAM